MKTSYFSIKNNVTCNTKLWDIWQGTTGNSQSTRQIATIPTRYSQEIWSIDRPWKPKILQETTQTQWMTSKIVFETIRLWLYPTIYPRKDKHKRKHTV